MSGPVNSKLLEVDAKALKAQKSFKRGGLVVLFGLSGVAIYRNFTHPVPSYMSLGDQLYMLFLALLLTAVLVGLVLVGNDLVSLPDQIKSRKEGPLRKVKARITEIYRELAMSFDDETEEQEIERKRSLRNELSKLTSEQKEIYKNGDFERPI